MASRTGSARSVDGQVRSRKTLSGLVANGCGLDDTTVTTDNQGRFRLTIPSTQPGGECTLRLTASTHRPPATQQQQVTYTATVTVN